jgi:1-acyl-sn-glycerol-3-phosphate acyltransferase
VVPPRVVRRVVLAPVTVVATVFAWTALPLTALIAAAVSPWLPGRWRPLRVLWFLLVFLVVESLALIGLLGLWLASGFGARIEAAPFQRAHHRLMSLYLDVVVRSATRVFNLQLDVLGPEPASAEGRPELVLSRHAGPGDSFLLVHALTSAGRRPRVVLKAALQWAPALDVLLNRIPSAFVGRGAARHDAVQHIAELAAGLEAHDALVIFPEGGNFTEDRRLRSIAKLEELGQHDRAERARTMRYVLAPRSTGVLAALDAAPQADVLFVAHTGLEDLSGVVDLWRGMPLDAAVHVQAWRVPVEEIPTDEAGRISWLDGWWHRIDHWILDHRGEAAVPDPVLDELPDQPPGSPADDRS